MVNIRLATIEDLEELNKIYNWAVVNSTASFDLEERSYAKAHDWFLSHQAPEYPLYVLEKDHLMVGWGSLSPYHSRPAYRYTSVFSIYLASDFQGQGLGHLLLSHLCTEGIKLNYHSLIGLISAENIPSIKLAEKHGFTQVGYYKEVGYKFNRWIDLVTMQKRL